MKICPMDAIEVYRSLYAQVNEDRCVYCPMGTMTQLICKAKNAK